MTRANPNVVEAFDAHGYIVEIVQDGGTIWWMVSDDDGPMGTANAATMEEARRAAHARLDEMGVPRKGRGSRRVRVTSAANPRRLLTWKKANRPGEVDQVWEAENAGYKYKIVGHAAHGYTLFREGEEERTYNTLHTAQEVAEDIAVELDPAPTYGEGRYDNPRLKAKDKRVIRAFTEKRPMEGDLLESDGETLTFQTGLGGGATAWWTDEGKVNFAAPGGKLEQTIQNAVRREVPHKWLLNPGRENNPGTPTSAADLVRRLKF